MQKVSIKRKVEQNHKGPRGEESQAGRKIMNIEASRIWKFGEGA